MILTCREALGKLKQALREKGCVNRTAPPHRPSEVVAPLLDQQERGRGRALAAQVSSQRSSMTLLVAKKDSALFA